ncbi:hypothetical protein PoB_000436700 [Plakobranchus ocellatus]|uniref:Uncharacterized protein n=1 Tax=Plakobranchus ocellatus TaxID=259542 RepID=A0AAV3Y5Z3_9GAST|nr:hypothetical protein PoB_000436700 [Plakobranchus ocellatus]
MEYLYISLGINGKMGIFKIGREDCSVDLKSSREKLCSGEGIALIEMAKDFQRTATADRQQGDLRLTNQKGQGEGEWFASYRVTDTPDGFQVAFGLL